MWIEWKSSLDLTSNEGCAHLPRAIGVVLPRLTVHGLRHTWANLALQAGIDIKIVSDRLNHSSTHITRKIYTHVTPPMRSDAAGRVAARIFGSPAMREGT